MQVNLKERTLQDLEILRKFMYSDEQVSHPLIEKLV